ncbi:cob(I)yrinic acid a,c-diamide adenosyltransferase [Colwellia sp. 1_MG-2023]|uniref:cob(I)yrinic acid a,c-diamide adenosyltransferase n=1 Tax=unclassified Colwellia TaxID=196834 RepID=UPI001C0A1BEB|nr:MULTISPECIES: cob(I)yrinic acid a,c-diamide adenosyltransferase [unclassified Colwellia]MBU2923548.1 cob(I)yrinic acid a,c-diamide adenosyltransferase [Colwellia sp. C2M11]MDO6486116.1 cob(I)yrinic acid a,c-diamide adenosyltransferase [Colwellia sp. 6_MG-2023]MDO6653277.1 cob(I)yrinic acid a,c-diamide adenosyltransferase [Colwellia sp. 3_MG-2023]MDO6664478.1 cob(I)yrinic acid a,c-diamide adenosyltransferase [Colwellia sp. 2_MG-2023]MDO6688829.1 cob(I)yrinic acid a,c-diamide adenosyltransfer
MNENQQNDNRLQQQDEAAQIKEQKHIERQKKIKAKVDNRIAQATEERGVFVVITGNGKGKSTSGFGTVLRAIGHGQKAGVVQFIKGDKWECGEMNILKQFPVQHYVMGTGFTWETQSTETDTIAAKVAWQRSKEMLSDETLNIVLLDEMTYMVKYGYIELDEIIEVLNNRPKMQHVIITGRACHRKLIELADTVSEVQPIKHAFKAGVKAQKGLDW